MPPLSVHLRTFLKLVLNVSWRILTPKQLNHEPENGSRPRVLVKGKTGQRSSKPWAVGKHREASYTVGIVCDSCHSGHLGIW